MTSLGMIPDDIPQDEFVDGEVVNEVKLYQRFFSRFNKTRQILDPLQMIWKAVAASNSNVVPTGTGWTTMNVDTMIIDTVGIGISGGAFVAPESMTVEAMAYAVFPASATGIRRYIGIGVNGVPITGDARDIYTQASQPPNAVANGTANGGPWALLRLAAGDILKPAMIQDSGASFNTSTAVSARPCLTIRRWL